MFVIPINLRVITFPNIVQDSWMTFSKFSSKFVHVVLWGFFVSFCYRVCNWDKHEVSEAIVTFSRISLLQKNMEGKDCKKPP